MAISVVVMLEFFASTAPKVLGEEYCGGTHYCVQTWKDSLDDSLLPLPTLTDKMGQTAYEYYTQIDHGLSDNHIDQTYHDLDIDVINNLFHEADRSGRAEVTTSLNKVISNEPIRLKLEYYYHPATIQMVEPENVDTTLVASTVVDSLQYKYKAMIYRKVTVERNKNLFRDNVAVSNYIVKNSIFRTGEKI